MRAASMLSLIGPPLFATAAVYAQAAGDEGKQMQLTVVYGGFVAHAGKRDTVPIRHEYDLTLSNRNHLSVRHVWGGHISHYDGTLGLPIKFSGVVPHQVVWRFLPGNRLVGVDDLPQNKETIDISIAGAECTAAVTAQLKPGFTEFVGQSWFTNEADYQSQREITFTSCSMK
jgi:hypothetical protein